MCASCGCGIPEDDHGDSRNLVWSQIQDAAAAQEIAVNDVVNNIHTMVHESHKVDQKPDPEPIKDAKTKLLTKNWDLWDAEHETGDNIKKAMHGHWVNGQYHEHSHRISHHREYKNAGRGNQLRETKGRMVPDLHSHPEGHFKIKALHKVVRGLGDEIADAILKGQTREETGRFVPGKSDTHSHKMGDEIVTHTHESEKGHTHPSREYGPSYNHR